MRLNTATKIVCSAVSVFLIGATPAFACGSAAACNFTIENLVVQSDGTVIIDANEDISSLNCGGDEYTAIGEKFLYILPSDPGFERLHALALMADSMDLMITARPYQTVTSICTLSNLRTNLISP